jgi:STE24 endopeptidase
VIAPIFNRFERLPDGETRRDVLELARRAGVEVGEVYVADASRRTTAVNAYVTGIGRTKRVVLFDTLLDGGFTRDEVRLVVAHELAHVRHRDVQRGLVLLAATSPPLVWSIARLARRMGARPEGAGLPAVALAGGIVAPAFGMVANWFSRRMERRADAFAMGLVADPRTQIAVQRALCVRNVAEPEPPRWVRIVFGSHPTSLERIAMAESFRASEVEASAS